MTNQFVIFKRHPIVLPFYLCCKTIIFETKLRHFEALRHNSKTIPIEPGERFCIYRKMKLLVVLKAVISTSVPSLQYQESILKKNVLNSVKSGNMQMLMFTICIGQ